MKSSQAVLFLDTNILLHFKPLRDIDWPGVAGAKTVKIILCPQVIYELDRHKYTARLSQRADVAVQEIQSIQNAHGQVREDVCMEVSSIQVRREEIPGNLSPDHQDTQIIFSAKKYLAEHPDETVAIVSGDLGMERLCKSNGVGCIALGPEFRLPVIQDEERKQYQQAVKELASLKNRLPSLSVIAKIIIDDINPPDPYCVVELQPLTKPRLSIEAEMHKLAEEYQKMPKLPHGMANSGGSRATFPLTVDQAEIDRYNQELDSFFKNYRSALLAQTKELEAQARSFLFELWLENNGGAPATEVEVCVYFPSDGINVYQASECLTAGATFPRPPKKPRSQLAKLQELIEPHHERMQRVIREAGPAPNVSKPAFGFEENTEVHVTVGRIKHRHVLRLGTFRVAYPDWDSIRPFEASWSTHANERPEPQVGNLVFRVTHGKAP